MQQRLVERLSPMVILGVERRVRVLEDHLNALAPKLNFRSWSSRRVEGRDVAQPLAHSVYLTLPGGRAARAASWQLPSVLLPQPDSPTTPNVSPSWIWNDTSLTARTTPVTRLRSPPLRIG